MEGRGSATTIAQKDCIVWWLTDPDNFKLITGGTPGITFYLFIVNNLLLTSAFGHISTSALNASIAVKTRLI